MADNPVTATSTTTSTDAIASPSDAGSSGAGAGAGADVELANEFNRLVDQLLPPEPTPRRRLVTGFAIVGTAIVVAVAWALGFVAPNPSYGQSYSSSTSLIAVEDPDLVALSTLWFRNSSRATLNLAEVEIDAPGLTLDHLEWYPDDRNDEAADGDLDETSDDGGSVTVTEPASEDSASFLEMLLRSESTQTFPAVVDPGESVRVIAYMRVDDCSQPIVDPSGTWGTVRGRWEYPNRPSWWHRWEPLDRPLHDPNGGWLQDFRRVDGERTNATGPLTGACEALGVQS